MSATERERPARPKPTAGPPRWLAAALAFALCLAAGRSAAQEMPMPLKLQVALFKKIFAYDKELAQVERPRVLVVHAAGYARDADEVLALFADADIAAEPVLESEIESRSAGASALYVLPRAGHAGLRERSERAGLLTISGVPYYAEAGHVAVALSVRPDGRAEIIVNLARVRAEGHELSSNLLKLARVIQ